MKNLLYIAIFILSCLLFSCQPKEEPKAFGSVYGSVIDKKTSKSISNAGVELRPIGTQTVTGSDGLFEFPKVEEGNGYYLYVTRIGYEDYKSEEFRVKGNAVPKKMDVLLEPQPTALSFVDAKGQKIDSLDFGLDEGVTIRSFSIANNTNINVKWKITYQCVWIKSFNKTEGELTSGHPQPIDITIDRDKLNLGYNSTIIHLESNNGSKELKIIATKVNVVETEKATDIGSQTAVLNAYVVRNMKPSITEYGFVYNTKPAPTLVNGAFKKSISSTPKVGAYSMLVDELKKNTTYYACAFVKNEDETIYGGQISFSTISHIPQISISNIESQGNTITVSYKVSDAGIPLKEVGLCWDTEVLPTKEKNYKKFGEEAKSYSSTLKDLLPNTLYYVRVYAQNEEGTVYSEEKKKTTDSGLPEVVTNDIYDKDKGTTYLNVTGKVTSDSGIPVTRKGICWSTEHDPSIKDNVIEANIAENPFTCKIVNLQPGTTYYIRAFAENSIGVGYGTKKECVTKYEQTTLIGYVFDQNSKPLQDVTIEEYNTYKFSTTTNASGYYEISMQLKSDETCKLRARKDGYKEQMQSVSLHPGQTTKQDFSLTEEDSSQPTIETGSYIIMPDGSFMVQTVDLGSAQWYSAKSKCENSTLGGYSDWRLPTLSELKKMYTYRTQIGGFPSRAVSDNCYWSSNEGTRSGYFYYVDFNTGQEGEIPRVNSFKIRAVRSIK